MSIKLLLVGDVLVDVSLKTSSSKTKMRLGGIIHAARYLWAEGIDYDVAYFAPSFLDDEIADYLKSLNCNKIIKLGDITGCPYVILIEEVKEVGDQGYELILREKQKIQYNTNSLSILKTFHYSDTFIISGNFSLPQIISNINADRFHLDLANNVGKSTDIESLGKELNTIFLSTSSQLFKSEYQNDFIQFASIFQKHCERIILKENRGGSRLYNFFLKETLIGFTQIRPIVHSVGVGDVFDAAFVCNLSSHSENESLTLASWISAEYASTTFIDDFAQNVKRIYSTPIQSMVQLKGISVAWEKRSKINIYIAGPDFDFMDTTKIDLICNALKYHNFSPRRPIKENGQMEKDATSARKEELFRKDIKLLNECSILLAILLNNDPGTLIEIGIAAQMGMPTIVFDPNMIATNCMLTQLPTFISSDSDEVLCEIFVQSDRLINE